MSDTIAAISTAPGEGGVGIVRISGPDSLKIMKRVLKKCPLNPIPRHAYYSHVVDDEGKIIDEVLAIYMKAPHTYTCEDVVELQAHGSNVSLRLILRSVLKAGARPAEPGEFTKIAFLNGRLDLSQAEAVIDLIRAESEIPLSIAADQLGGHLGKEVREIRNELKDILAQMAVNIDFPDEDIEQITFEEFTKGITKSRDRVLSLLHSADSGRIAKEGIKIAISGRPNVGKSSLMNALLGENRAIVTDIPGTTRDTIEECASVSGYPLVLIDTAGIRETEDLIEKIGIERSRKAMDRADLVLMVFDGSKELNDEDKIIADAAKGKKVLAVINKKDLGCIIKENEIKEILPECNIVTTSLIDSHGPEIIRNKIEEVFLAGAVKSSAGNIITNERHRQALERTKESLNDSLNLLENMKPLEITEIEVHEAYDSLGEIIGETAGEEILDTVFSRFCLGK